MIASSVAKSVARPVASSTAGIASGGSSIPATLALFMGQSNADGWSVDPASSTALTLGYGYEYYHSSPVGVLLPLGRNRLGRTTGGPQPAFCQTWAAGGGGPVVCVDCACGGSSMTSAYKTTLTGTSDLANLSGGTWDQTDGANIYDNYYKTHIDNAIRDVRAAGFSIEHLVVYFSQGEQDSAGNSPQATYEASLRLFFNALKADFPTIKVFIEALGTNSTASNSAASTLIRNGQIAVAAEAAYSGWVTIGCNLAKDFSAAGKFADTLHYNQTGYNELGAAVATAGLAFVGSPSITVDTSPMTAILADLPSVTNWKRIYVDTSRNGTWNVQFYTDPTMPFATTWYDGSGVNSASADQSTTFTFSTSASKRVVGYISDTIGSSASFVSGTGFDADLVTFPDSGLKLNSVSLSALAVGANISEASISNLHAATIKSFVFNGGSNRTNFVLSNTALTALAGVTNLQATSSQPATFSLLLTPLVTTASFSKCGFSVAQVNQILIDLDANGLSGAYTVNVSQFQSSPAIAAAPPSGAGATAKTALQGKGWTVTTD